jgi:hypothetical protein
MLGSSVLFLPQKQKEPGAVSMSRKEEAEKPVKQYVFCFSQLAYMQQCYVIPNSLELVIHFQQLGLKIQEILNVPRKVGLLSSLTL